MRWRRLGCVLPPPRLEGWAVSHAMVPFARPVPGGGLELLFSARDAQGRSHTGIADLELDAAGTARVAVRPEPVLSPGALGGFDDSGAMGSCIVEDGDRLRLYYIGWSLGVTVPFATYIGCAVSDDGGRTYRRRSDGPVVGRSRHDPYLATSPWVMREGDRWRLWYAQGARWEQTPEGPKHYYRIVHAESADGVDWRPTGVCIDFADEGEYAIARPSVIRDGDLYRMWFSCRGSAYRIGYAESPDGLSWQRDDARAGLLPDGDGWESRSVEYGCVFDHNGSRWMLYNGNGYGETGIGLAVLEA